MLRRLMVVILCFLPILAQAATLHPATDARQHNLLAPPFQAQNPAKAKTSLPFDDRLGIAVLLSVKQQHPKAGTGKATPALQEFVGIPGHKAKNFKSPPYPSLAAQQHANAASAIVRDNLVVVPLTSSFVFMVTSVFCFLAFGKSYIRLPRPSFFRSDTRLAYARNG